MLESSEKEVKEEIENLYKSGLSIAKVAKETGVAGTQVRRVLRARKCGN